MIAKCAHALGAAKEIVAATNNGTTFCIVFMPPGWLTPFLPGGFC